MNCPFCKAESTRVLDSRLIEEGQGIRRRRTCVKCGKRFTTNEYAVLNVVKRSGVVEPFSREKIITGVLRACQGRNVSVDDLHKLTQLVEDSIRASGKSEINSNDIGLAILEPLAELDEVAYLRFASVYHSFDSAADFLTEINNLRQRTY